MGFQNIEGKHRNQSTKNVVLVNKALYSVDGVKLNISDEGTGSKLSDEGIKVETTTESLGKFSVVKMDIEGA